jgi:hypothetical protein
VLEKHKQSRQEADWKGAKRTEKRKEKHRKKRRHVSLAAYKASGVYCFAMVGDGTKTKSSGPKRRPHTCTLSSPLPPPSLSLSLSLFVPLLAHAACRSSLVNRMAKKPPTTPDLVYHDNYPNPKQDHRNTVGSSLHQRRKINQHRLSR